MVQINLARLQSGFTVIPYYADKIDNIRWASLPIIGRARLSTCAAYSFGGAELNSLTRLQPSKPGRP